MESCPSLKSIIGSSTEKFQSRKDILGKIQFTTGGEKAELIGDDKAHMLRQTTEKVGSACLKILSQVSLLSEPNKYEELKGAAEAYLIDANFLFQHYNLSLLKSKNSKKSLEKYEVLLENERAFVIERIKSICNTIKIACENESFTLTPQSSKYRESWSQKEITELHQNSKQLILDINQILVPYVQPLKIVERIGEHDSFFGKLWGTSPYVLKCLFETHELNHKWEKVRSQIEKILRKNLLIEVDEFLGKEKNLRLLEKNVPTGVEFLKEIKSKRNIELDWKKKLSHQSVRQKEILLSQLQNAQLQKLRLELLLIEDYQGCVKEFAESLLSQKESKSELQKKIEQILNDYPSESPRFLQAISQSLKVDYVETDLQNLYEKKIEEITILAKKIYKIEELEKNQWKRLSSTTPSDSIEIWKRKFKKQDIVLKYGEDKRLDPPETPDDNDLWVGEAEEIIAVHLFHGDKTLLKIFREKGVSFIREYYPQLITENMPLLDQHGILFTIISPIVDRALKNDLLKDDILLLTKLATIVGKDLPLPKGVEILTLAVYLSRFYRCLLPEISKYIMEVLIEIYRNAFESDLEGIKSMEEWPPQETEIIEVEIKNSLTFGWGNRRIIYQDPENITEGGGFLTQRTVIWNPPIENWEEPGSIATSFSFQIPEGKEKTKEISTRLKRIRAILKLMEVEKVYKEKMKTIG